MRSIFLLHNDLRATRSKFWKSVKACLKAFLGLGASRRTPQNPLMEMRTPPTPWGIHRKRGHPKIEFTIEGFLSSWIFLHLLSFFPTICNIQIILKKIPRQFIRHTPRSTASLRQKHLKPSTSNKDTRESHYIDVNIYALIEWMISPLPRSNRYISPCSKKEKNGVPRKKKNGEPMYSIEK